MENYFLKMVTDRDVMVKGGSKEVDHVDWLEVLRFDLKGTSNTYKKGAYQQLYLIIAGKPADLYKLDATGAHFPIVILDVPAHRQWFVFREAFIDQLWPSDSNQPDETTTTSLLFKSIEVYYGAYAPTAAAAAAAVQAGTVLISVGLAKLRRFLTK